MQSLPKLAGDRVHVHYQVKSVQEVDHEKILHLEGTYKCEQVVVHLRDCWFDTPVEPGHSVNLLAEKVLEDDGVLHAVCNFQAGRPVIPTCLMTATSILLIKIWTVMLLGLLCTIYVMWRSLVCQKQ